MCRRLPRTSRSLRPLTSETHGLVTKGLIDCSNGVLVRGGLMETSAPAQSASGRYPRLASPIHTILVLAAIGGWATGHRIFADQLSATANPNRVGFYLVTLLYEWLLFVLVVVGVRRSGTSVITVLGEHWHSVRQVVRDIGIAAGFYIVAWMLLSVSGWLLRTAALGRNVSMLPERGIELTFW